MTTGLAPPTIPSVETGTSPKKWSESVLASSPAMDTPAMFSGRTEHPDMPAEKSQVSQEIKQTVASDPSSKGGKEKRRVSLPSTELKGAQPLEHTGGVGALPGNLSESSVALLPDERQESAQGRRTTCPRQRRDTMKPSTVGGDDETQPTTFEKEGAKIPRDVMLPKDEPVTSQPLHEVESQKEASETKSKEAETQSEPWRVAAVAATAEEQAEKNIEATDELDRGKSPSRDVQEGENEEGRREPTKQAEGGYGGDYHPAQLHPPPPGASVAEYQGTTSVQQQEQDEPTTKTGQQAAVGAEKKHGFMTVVKGEMKILAGKMSGDEHKVEEGKRLVHGDA